MAGVNGTTIASLRRAQDWQKHILQRLVRGESPPPPLESGLSDSDDRGTGPGGAGVPSGLGRSEDHPRGREGGGGPYAVRGEARNGSGTSG